MSKIAVSRYEMETHITWNAEKKIATVYTCDPTTIRKLDKLVSACPDAYHCIWEGENPTTKKYTLPARYVRFGKPATEAQKAARKRGYAASHKAQGKATA